MPPRTKIDREKLTQYVERVVDGLAAGLNCAISALGDQLGLYQALHDIRIASSAELADRTGLNERWVREWLRQQACVELIEYDAETDRFYLSPEAIAVLLDAAHPAHFGGGFEAVTASFASLPGLVHSFRTGIGFTYDDHGAGCARGIERMSRHFNEHMLVRDVLPCLEGVLDKLERGAAVADLGCGSGLATIAMAESFPASAFIGYDISEHALARARDNAATLDLPNLRFANPETDPIPGVPTFDFITTFDVIHDAPRPQSLLNDVFAALKQDGTFLCQDVRSFTEFDQNRREHPFASLLYGFSIMVCLSSAMSEADGAGLGTLGFNERVAREMTEAAGFSHFHRLELDNPLSSYYEVRK